MADLIPEKIKFSEILAAVTDLSKPFPPRLLRGFTDLGKKEIRELLSVWNDLPILRKQSLLEDLEDLMDSDTLMNFDEIGKAFLTDLEPIIRILALRLLWECEDSKIVQPVTELMMDDPDENVRATAASLLGKFVYAGELDSIPDTLKIPIVNHLIEVVGSDDLIQVKRRALESLGYSCDSRIPKLIQNAYDSNNDQWLASALCAMGRSADEQWTDHVLDQLDAEEDEILFEAARAAGELEISNATRPLVNILEEEETDPEIRYAAIWSLSQIGGNEAKEKLEDLLKNAEDDEELEWVEQAVDNLEFSLGTGLLNFIPRSENDLEEDLDEEDPLFNDEEGLADSEDMNDEDDEE